MSRAGSLARAFGSDGTLNTSDVSGLAAVASSGSASDLSTGTLPIARIADGAVTAIIVDNKGYSYSSNPTVVITPDDGDTITVAAVDSSPCQ